MLPSTDLASAPRTIAFSMLNSPAHPYRYRRFGSLAGADARSRRNVVRYSFERELAEFAWRTDPSQPLGEEVGVARRHPDNEFRLQSDRPGLGAQVPARCSLRDRGSASLPQVSEEPQPSDPSFPSRAGRGSDGVCRADWSRTRPRSRRRQALLTEDVTDIAAPIVVVALAGTMPQGTRPGSARVRTKRLARGT